MNMRMQMKVLSPGVQYRQKPDICTEAFGIGGDCEQCFRRGAEKDSIDFFRVL
jgi:hypothetical protein